MITVSKPVIQENGTKTRMIVDVSVDDLSNEIWFEVDAQYGKFLCTERSDALFVMLFYYAMINGHDITFQGEITEQLYYGIKCNLMEAMCESDPRFYNSRIFCNTTSAEFSSENKAATGVSCGIDSLSTIYVNISKELPENFRLNYLTFFNAGAAYRPNGTKVYTTDGNDIEKQRIDNAYKVSEELGLPLIVIDSNINEFLKLDYVFTHTFRNCAMAMLLQKLISKYYYASTGMGYQKVWLNHMSNAGNYDNVSLPCISNGIITYYSSLDYCTRLNKTKIISDFTVAQKYLNVCILEGKNCGHCHKCVRTLTALDVLGKLEDFSQVFDMADYKINRRKYLLKTIIHNDEHFYDEIFKAFKDKKQYTPSLMLLGKMFNCLKNIKRKLRYIRNDSQT